MKSKILIRCQPLIERVSLIVVVLILMLGLGLPGLDPAWATLAQGDAITDPSAILRYALPIDNDAVRRLQGSVEDIARHLRGKRWSPINSDVKTASRVLSLKQDQLLETVLPDFQGEAKSIVEQIDSEVKQLKEAVENRDTEAVWLTRRQILDNVSELEEMMVQRYPFEVPEEYAGLPQLLGRATVLVETTKGDLTVVVDGYSAPVNAGNFVDLVDRGFYDGLPFIRAGDDDFVVQTGDPEGEADGFVDPKTGEYRSIPLEVLVEGDEQPVYGETLENLGRYLDPPVLPFNAYGAVALARPNDDPNGGSSQFFFFKFDTELTPPGYNLLDGRYSVFGYVVDGKDVLADITTDDKIISAKVLEGKEHLVQPS